MHGKITSSRNLKILFFQSFLILLLKSFTVSAENINIIGRITDPLNNGIPAANVAISVNSVQFKVNTGSDGYYSLQLSNIFPGESKEIKIGKPFPNPFSASVSIPLVISTNGDIHFAMYDLAGRKADEMIFNSVPAGSYRINWSGQDPVTQQGIYIYAITFRGKTYSGKLIKAAGVNSIYLEDGLEPYLFQSIDSTGQDDPSRIPLVANISKNGYHQTRMTDITVTRDTTLNFILYPEFSKPFITSGDYFSFFNGKEYQPMILKGINLGVSPPGYFPGEVATSISPVMYESWIRMMAESGFNSVRVYTLHPPVFYEKLAEYNLRNPGKPLYLFQGIWLDEIEDPGDNSQYDLTLRATSFISSIREVINCVHGNKSIPFRPGRAFGDYLTDASPWVAGFIIGREIDPYEVMMTDTNHPGDTSFTGSVFGIRGSSATELFLTKMLDETANYEIFEYSKSRPVSVSSWPTLDPLTHITEIHTDEDRATVDITKITEINDSSRLFASYHAYPYYPDFVSDELSYRTFTDEEGYNSYLGYLTALKNHYHRIPLVIAEFGVPSSWSSAHQAFSGMHHGGFSEIRQGEYNLRMMKNILSAGAGGGFMFSWMDEWFKPTWIVGYLEAFGLPSGENIKPTRQLWHNLTSPEQNFGLISFEETKDPVMEDYLISSGSTMVNSVKSGFDNSFFHIEIETSVPASENDILMIGFDTYLKDTGESTLPGGYVSPNRSEFLLIGVKGADTASFYVTEAYNMAGLTPRFNLSDTTVQKYRSTVSDGGPWVFSYWINNGFSGSRFDIGRLPAGDNPEFDEGEREALAWSGNKVKIRIPWTMLHFYDPTSMRVIDGASTADEGRSYTITDRVSDGIALSVVYKGELTYTLSRYAWPSWLIVPDTKVRVKKSLEIISTGIKNLPDKP